jgi:hypothetical protein
MRLLVRCSWLACVLFWASFVGLPLALAQGQPQVRPASNDAFSWSANYRSDSTARRAISAKHPLAPVLKYARDEQAYLKSAVQDFSCRLVKRERIDGRLQKYQYIDMEVREGQSQDGKVVQPLSVYLSFAGPPVVAGRKVLYVEGQHEGKMLVRKGGPRLSSAVLKLDPKGGNALSESLLPITEAGFTPMLGQLVAVLEMHAAADPTGANTQVEWFSHAKIEERPCDAVRIVHAKEQPGLAFYMANVFVDTELNVPVRIAAYGWPEKTGDQPPVLAEYTYTDLRLNVNLDDGAFDPERLKTNEAAR